MNIEPIKTGFNGLDSVIGGYIPGTINVISGRKQVGKTALALNIAKNVANNSGKAVAYYSGKETKSEITDRLMKSAVRHLCKTNELESIDSFTNHFAKLPIYVDDFSIRVTDFIVAGITKLKSNGIDVGLVIIDDFESVIKSNVASFDCLENGFKPSLFAIHISFSAIRTFAEKTGISFLLIADIFHMFEETENRVPTLKEIGNYEPCAKYADTIVYLDCPENTRMFQSVYPFSKLIVCKNRDGACDVRVEFNWDEKKLQFSEPIHNSESHSVTSNSDIKSRD